MLRTISSLRLSPRFSLPCRREQSIGKIPGWTGLQVRQHSFYSSERKTEIFKRITDRDTAKIHRRKVVVESVAIATLLPVVYFRRMRFYRMLISRKNRISLRELARNRSCCIEIAFSSDSCIDFKEFSPNVGRLGSVQSNPCCSLN